MYNFRKIIIFKIKYILTQYKKLCYIYINNKYKKGKMMKFKKIISLVCLFSLIFTNFISFNTFAIKPESRIVFLGDIVSIKQNRISSRVKERNRDNVWKTLDKTLFTKFNIGAKEYIDFYKLPYNRISRERKRNILRSADAVVVVVSYTEYNIRNVVSRYVEDVDMDNIPVILVGYVNADNGGRGEEYKRSVNDAAGSCGIKEDNVFFVDFMTGDGIEEVDLNIEILCLKDEEAEDTEVHQPTVLEDPTSDNIDDADLGDVQALNDEKGKELDDEHQKADSESSVNVSYHDGERPIQKKSSSSKVSNSEEKNKIDWTNVLKIGTVGSGISSMIMLLLKKIIPSRNVDKSEVK